MCLSTQIHDHDAKGTQKAYVWWILYTELYLQINEEYLCALRPSILHNATFWNGSGLCECYAVVLYLRIEIYEGYNKSSAYSTFHTNISYYSDDDMQGESMIEWKINLTPGVCAGVVVADDYERNWGNKVLCIKDDTKYGRRRRQEWIICLVLTVYIYT